MIYNCAKSKWIIIPLVCLIFTTYCRLTIQAQTYVGNILHKGDYQYIKLENKNNQWLFSLPYEEVSAKYPVNVNPLVSKNWGIQRNFESVRL